MSSKIIIGVSSRLCKNKFENRDSLSTDWYKFFKKLNILEKANWIILPNIGKDIKKYIHKNKINRFILTGGDYRNNKFDWIFSWKTCVEKYLNLIENCF